VSDHTQVRMMVLGYGYWGVNQARNVAAAPTAELVAIVEPDPGRAAMAAQRHPGVLIVSTPEAALAAAPEAAIIATPASTHREVGDSLLGAGIHLLVEKPFAMTGDDARALVAAGAAADRHVVAGHTFLYSAPVRHLKMLIERGDLGEVRYLSFQRLSLGRIRSDCNVLWNLAPHDVSIALHLLGAPAAQAAATGHTFLQPDIADVVFGSLTFPSGAVAGLHLSWLDPRKTRMVTVVGTERMAVYDDVATDRKIEVFDAGVVDPTVGPGETHTMAEWQWRTRAGDIVTKRLDLWEPLRLQVEEFAALIRTGAPVPTGPAHAIAVTDALEALDASIAADGTPVAVRTDAAPG
jgi:predicted dehydrogenase